MDPFLTSALVSAGSNLLGGFLGRSSQEEQREANAALQREFAQNAIQWKVADAKKAGIHPLYAMGAPSISPAVSVQSDPLASSLSSMGSDVSRAMMASATSEQRDKAVSGVTEEMTRLGLERAGLQNELLRSQIARLRAAQVGPPAPAIGETENFPVPANPKSEQRPPLMFGGDRWRTNPNTSPMKAWEDQYGDEGPVASIMPLLILWQDLKANYGQPSSWPLSALNRMADAVESFVPSREQVRSGMGQYYRNLRR